MNKFIILAFLLLLGACKSEPTSDFIDLLKDPEMPLLIKRGGDAVYELKDGVLTGRAKMGTHNTFLCTKENFSNFILDFKVSVDPRLNSGVQIRSHAFDYKGKEAIKGYQVEIDPSDRGWSGGIYEESRRGWICNLANNKKGRMAFKNGKWNNYHIEAIDNSIKVWVNGINTSNMLDSLCKEGLIGFQVHSIGDSSLIDIQASWKDIHLYTKNLNKYKLKNTELAEEKNLLVNQLSTQEKKDGWTLLSNKAFYDKVESTNGWTISDNNLCQNGNSVEAITLGEVGNDFELKLEYTIDKGGLASIAYGQYQTQGEKQDKKQVDTQVDVLEYVISDDKNASDALKDNQKAGSLKDKIVARNLTIPRKDKALRAHDQWSPIHIKAKNEKIQHWLNDNLVVDNTNQIKVTTYAKNIIKIKPDSQNLCVRSIKLKSNK